MNDQTNKTLNKLLRSFKKYIKKTISNNFHESKLFLVLDIERGIDEAGPGM